MLTYDNQPSRRKRILVTVVLIIAALVAITVVTKVVRDFNSQEVVVTK